MEWLTPLGLDAVSVGIGLLIGGVIGWMLSQVKTFFEIRKLNEEKKKLEGESIKNTGDLFKAIHGARNAYVLASDECGMLSDALSAAWDGTDEAELNTAREQLARHFDTKVLPLYLQDVEYQILERTDKNDPSEFEQVIVDAVNELNRFRGWLSTINHPAILTRLPGKHAIEISDRRFRPLEKVYKRLPDSIRNDCGRRVAVAIESIVNPNRTAQQD